MEEIHVGLIYPKKFFGIMMAIFIEEKPITQDRIEELTEYSKTTISQLLTLIQVNFPIKQIKKPGVRKRFYTIGIGPKEFMMTFLQMMLDAYKDKIDFMLPLIKELQPYINQHPRFYNFKMFLEKYYEMSNLYVGLLSNTVDEFKNLITIGKISASEISNFNFLSSFDNLKHVQEMLNPSKTTSKSIDQPIIDKKLALIYIQFKERFYQEFRENLTSAGYQTNLARTIIGTELLLENRPLNQEEIEKITKFQRSVVSDTLKRLVQWKMVEIIKIPGDRKKYYMMVLSWDARIINKFKLNQNYGIIIKKKVSQLIKKAQKNEKNTSLINSLQHVYNSYDQFEQYFKLLEVKYLNIRLKEYLKIREYS